MTVALPFIAAFTWKNTPVCDSQLDRSAPSPYVNQKTKGLPKNGTFGNKLIIDALVSKIPKVI